MINPRDVAFFVPPGLKKFKLDLFERIGRHIRDLGGEVIKHDYAALERRAGDRIPIVGCTPQFRQAVERWRAERLPWIYWDRGYLRRVFATWLPKGSDMGIPGGYYRWHVGTFQMETIRDVPDDRWRALKLDHCVKPWSDGGDKIVIADTLPDYWNLRGLGEDWSKRTAARLGAQTSRPIVIRDKESKVPLDRELNSSHALLTHGSIAAVEAAIFGYPVFVDSSSAAALVGQTDFDKIEEPIRPDRRKWLHSLAYCQFNERELCDGTLWRLLE